jgi:hypothetical protein
MLTKPSKPFSAPWIDSEAGSLPASWAWETFSLADGEGLCSPDLERSEWACWAAQLPGLLKSDAAEPMRQAFIPTSGRQTFRVAGPRGQFVVVKRYTPAATEKCSTASMTAGRHAWRAFRCQVELSVLGQPVPKPLLFLSSREDPSSWAWYSVSHLLENSTPLIDFAFAQLRRQPSRSKHIRTWVEDIVGSIARLHQCGYAHGDLHQENILVRHKPAEEHLQVFWTDFDACEAVVGSWPQRAHLWDLAMLGASLHNLVSEARLRRALARYFALGGLNAARRHQAHRVVQQAFRSFLEESRKGFEIVEQHCLAEAERSLARSDLLP